MGDTQSQKLLKELRQRLLRFDADLAICHIVTQALAQPKDCAWTLGIEPKRPQPPAEEAQ